MDVGVIGVGSMGRNHVRVYSELKGVGNVYAYDPDPAGSLRSKDLATVCSSEEELLSRCDAVSICVPTKYHFAVAKRVIEKDLPFLLEKPITLHLEEAIELLKLIEGKDLVVGVGHIERFNPIVSEISKIYKEPAWVEIKRHNPTSTRITDASVVEDLMIHDIDIAWNVLFPQRDDYKLFSAGNRNVCKAVAVFGKSVVSISASRLSSKKIRTMYLEDEGATTEGDFMNQEIYVYRKPGVYLKDNDRYLQENIIEKVLVNKVEPLKVELKAFIDAVNGKGAFPVTLQQAARNLRVCSEVSRGFLA
jgi:predicted dehydrogenase